MWKLREYVAIFFCKVALLGLFFLPIACGCHDSPEMREGEKLLSIHCLISGGVAWSERDVLYTTGAGNIKAGKEIYNIPDSAMAEAADLLQQYSVFKWESHKKNKGVMDAREFILTITTSWRVYSITFYDSSDTTGRDIARLQQLLQDLDRLALRKRKTG